jgi:hypothetical protein
MNWSLAAFASRATRSAPPGVAALLGTALSAEVEIDVKQRSVHDGTPAPQLDIQRR